jgi:CMP-N-acetylneuraminic acid synthetase
MKKSLCIIPARGGSKRIPGKNLLPLGGKPLIAHSIDAALASGVFTQVLVSTDSKELLEIAEAHGASVDVRPENLSGDKTRAVEVVEEYLLRDDVAGRYEYVAMLLPTCPFRSSSDVKSAVESFLGQTSSDYLIAVSEYDFPPQLSMSIAVESKAITMNDPVAYRTSTRSQEQKNYYHPNGAIYMARVDKFLASHTFFADPMMAYVMPPERSFDIDYPYQFEIAECMMEKVKADEE